ncbi:MAG: aspartyl-phosphate phosphatase Spo0E family protein [Clostridia bacterium]|nr:aspartyl-phosphate phosphatase Spo0E family protein [Clostridia bacterium]MDD4047542.1 aspartyl-phosphate phosphatase Spo0E family protein [Clostridia bacterium]
MANSNANVVQEMEKVRKELYVAVNGDLKTLKLQEIYKVSTDLDELIVRYMKSRNSENVS